MGFFDFMTEDIAIDLGTANTLIIHNDKVVIDSPSIVARDRVSGKIIAVGKEANLMQGKTHENIKTIRPLKDGVIADFDASEKMISMFIKSIPALKKKMFTPALRMVVCIPSGITEVEMRAVKESCERVNGKEVYLIHEPLIRRGYAALQNLPLSPAAMVLLFELAVAPLLVALGWLCYRAVERRFLRAGKTVGGGHMA